MDLVRLEKLVRLANNNPNEHEANLAARKACKLIEEGKFKFSAEQPKVNVKPSYSPYDDIFTSNKYWDGFTKAQEEVNKQTREQFNEEIRKAREAQAKESARRQKEADEKFKEGFNYNRTYQNEYYNNGPKIKKKRTCSECGTERETTNTDIYYICSGCQWLKYGAK